MQHEIGLIKKFMNGLENSIDNKMLLLFLLIWLTDSNKFFKDKNNKI